jgi:hypothetical protein
MAVKPMSFSECTDNLGAHDGVETYTTSGVWHVTFLDAPNDETTEPPAGPNSGDHLRITIPIKGITIITSIDPTCVVTVAPNGAVQVVGRYNDHNRLTIGFPGAPVPINYAATGTPGCPGGNGSSTGHFRATYVLTPGVHGGS